MLVDQDIPRLDVLVDDSPRMKVRDSARQLRDDPRGLSRPRVSLFRVVIQAPAVDVLHDHEWAALVEIEIDDLDQVGMLEFGQNLALADQSVTFGRVDGNRPSAQLENAACAENRMNHPEHVSLPAFAERLPCN
jgi:hypothetical protein